MMMMMIMMIMMMMAAATCGGSNEYDKNNRGFLKLYAKETTALWSLNS